MGDEQKRAPWGERISCALEHDVPLRGRELEIEDDDEVAGTRFGHITGDIVDDPIDSVSHVGRELAPLGNCNFGEVDTSDMPASPRQPHRITAFPARKIKSLPGFKVRNLVFEEDVGFGRPHAV